MVLHDVFIEEKGAKFNNIEIRVETKVVEDDLVNSSYEQSNVKILEKKNAPKQ